LPFLERKEKRRFKILLLFYSLFYMRIIYKRDRGLSAADIV